MICLQATQVDLTHAGHLVMLVNMKDSKPLGLQLLALTWPLLTNNLKHQKHLKCMILYDAIKHDTESYGQEGLHTCGQDQT